MNFDQVRGLATYRMKLVWEGTESIEWTQPDNPLSVTNKNFNVCANNGCKVPGWNSDAPPDAFSGTYLQFPCQFRKAGFN